MQLLGVLSPLHTRVYPKIINYKKVFYINGSVPWRVYNIK